MATQLYTPINPHKLVYNIPKKDDEKEKKKQRINLLDFSQKKTDISHNYQNQGTTKQTTTLADITSKLHPTPKYESATIEAPSVEKKSLINSFLDDSTVKQEQKNELLKRIQKNIDNGEDIKEIDEAFTQRLINDGYEKPVEDRRPENLFSDELVAYNNMRKDGIDNLQALEVIKNRRNRLFGGQLRDGEKEAFLKMQEDGLDLETVVNVVKQHRVDNAGLGEKAFNAGVGASSLGTEQIGNVLDFVTGGKVPYFKEQVEGVKNITNRSFSGQPGFQAGRNILGTGELFALGPTKTAPTMGGRTVQGAVTGGLVGAGSSILEKGSDATFGDITKGGVIGAGIGALAVPTLEKAVLPAVGGIAKGGMKLGQRILGRNKGKISNITQQNIGKNKQIKINQKTNGSQNNLTIKEEASSLTQKEKNALLKTNEKRLDEYINDAKNAVSNDKIGTPFEKAINKVRESEKSLINNINKRGKEKIKILEGSNVKVNTTIAKDDILKLLDDEFNVSNFKITKSGDIKLISNGKTILMDRDSDIKSLKYINDLLKSKTASEQAELIQKLQRTIYKNYSSTNPLSISTQMKNFYKQALNKVNENLKNQLPVKYRNVMKDLSDDTELLNQIDDVFGDGINRGESFIKKLVSGTTTSGDARKLALEIEKRTGIDLISEARLRNLSMRIAGDQRADTLFGLMNDIKKSVENKGIVGTIKDKALDKAANILGIDLEKAARNVIKQNLLTSKNIKPKKITTTPKNIYKSASFKDILGDKIDDLANSMGVRLKFIDDTRGISQNNTNLDKITKEFEIDINKLMNGEKLNKDYLSLGNAGEKIQLMGLKDIPIILRKNLRTKLINKHNLTLTDLKDLPNKLQNPIAGFNSHTTPGNKIILTEIQKEGKNIIVILKPNNEIIDIKSIYPRNIEKTIKALKKGEDIYIDRIKLNRYLNKNGVKLDF